MRGPSWLFCLGVGAVSVIGHNLFERYPTLPPKPLKVRLCGEAVDVAKAKIADRHNVCWNVQYLAETIRIEDADPSYAYAFGPGGEPKILYRTDGRVDRSLGHRMTAKLMATLTLRIAQNAAVLWSFQDAFELQTCVLLTSLAGVGCQGLFGCLQKCFMDGSADVVVSDQNEPRRLHKTDGRSAMSRGQQAVNQLVRQRLLQKASA